MKPKTTPGAQRETEEFLDGGAAPGGQGRSGGRLAQDVGTQDEGRVAGEDVVGVTGLTKSDEQKTTPRSQPR